ncbi:MAG: M23 family metallopeptidase [Bdellovibrionia bacterium]
MQEILRLRNHFAFILILFTTGCATAVTRTPQVGPQVHQGLLDRMGRFPSPVDLSPSTLRAMNHFKWPLRSMQVTSNFGQRGNTVHEGIDLRAMPGTPVYAVQAGKVLYANRKIRGYGNMIVLKHAGEISTIYAHNSKVLVRAGQAVKQGQIIAKSGNTGRSRGPHLHFEIRSGLGAIDPLQYIPRSYTAALPAAVVLPAAQPEVQSPLQASLRPPLHVRRHLPRHSAAHSKTYSKAHSKKAYSKAHSKVHPLTVAIADSR